MLPSAFEDKPLCVPRQLAELLQLSAEEVCSDFDAMLRHASASPPRRCASSACGATPRAGADDVCFLAFDGHCYMYRAVKRVLERQAARVLYWGEASCRPSESGGALTPRTCSRGCSGARTCARRAEAEAGHEDPRCEALGQEYRGQRLAGLAHEIFLKLLKAKREVPGAAERPGRAARLRADGRHLRAGPLVPVRQAFAGSVQTLQALCGDCHSEKTLRESAQPTSLESRVAPGVMEQYARSPKLPPLVSKAQACQRDALLVGVDVVRCRRNGLANAPDLVPGRRR